MADWICRERYRPAGLYLWLLVLLAALWLLIAAPFFIIAEISDGGRIPWSEFFIPVLAVAAGNFALLLPFLILSSASPFYRERLKALLNVKPEAPPPLNSPPCRSQFENLISRTKTMRKRKALDMKLKLTLAGMLVAAATAWAQPEQWLEYHTSNDGRVFHQMELTTNPPPGVALPKLNAPPYFARWKTPMDPAGGRWLCFDRSRKSGPYDRLFIDSTGNGRLDDKTPVPARLDSSEALFPATPVVFKGEDGPITYHLVFRFYQYENNQAQLLAASGGWYEGTVNFDGVKKRVTLIDGNVNGTFNDMAARSL